MKTLNPEKIAIKKRNDNREDFKLPKEIDFSGSVRGRFYRRFQQQYVLMTISFFSFVVLQVKTNHLIKLL